MKKILFLSIIIPGGLFAQRNKTATVQLAFKTTAITSQQVDTKIAAAISTLNGTIATQGKLITAQTDIINKLVADTLAKSNLLKQIAAKSFVQDTTVAQMTKRMNDLFTQNNSYKSQLTDIYKRSDTAKIYSDGLQKQINDVSDVSVKAFIEANRKDSINGVPGQIIITKMSWGFLFSLSPDFMLRLLKVEAKLPNP